MPENPEDAKALRLQWRVPPDVVPRYATHAVLQAAPREYLLSFFHVLPPILVGTPEEKRQQLKQIDTAESRCVAQVVLHESAARELLEVLTRNFDDAARRSVHESP